MDQYTVLLPAANTPAYTRTLPQANRRRCPLRAHAQFRAMDIAASLGLRVAERINTSRGGVRSAIVDLGHLQHESHPRSKERDSDRFTHIHALAPDRYFISFVTDSLTILHKFQLAYTIIPD